MRRDDPLPSVFPCWLLLAAFAVGLLHLGVRLWEIQITDSASYSYASTRQSVRRVQVAGFRGRILDRKGEALAVNRLSASVVCYPEFFQKRTWSETTEAIGKAISDVAVVIGRASPVTERQIRRHVDQSLALPLFVWNDIGDDELARFSEHESDFPGFGIIETVERAYPHGSVAAHLLGYVGRERSLTAAGDERFHYSFPELRGRAGVEVYYDSYLRGVPGEKKVLVDARGFAMRDWDVVQPRPGPDLRLTIDLNIQRLVERELHDVCGACVAIDPRNGEVLALASAPGYDPNAFVPVLTHDVYNRYAHDPAKPLLNRATGGAYAPGSTFKPVTALAGLSAGYPADAKYVCSGIYEMGEMSLHCSSRWGHGEMDIRHALMKSCNPFFCNLAASVGTNVLIRTARSFGLGSKTGIDFGIDMAGVVPDAEWKMKMYRERWYGADLVQMAIGQGMLLVSPLQMALVAGAIGTGRLVTPHLNVATVAESRTLPFPPDHLNIVRAGMRSVVAGDGTSRGTGWRGGDRLRVEVSGKTGTAEVGRGTARRKNTWFIGYAPSESPTVAIAMVIENGESGGGTTAPRVRNVLAGIFGETEVAR